MCAFFQFKSKLVPLSVSWLCRVILADGTGTTFTLDTFVTIAMMTVSIKSLLVVVVTSVFTENESLQLVQLVQSQET